MANLASHIVCRQPDGVDSSGDQSSFLTGSHGSIGRPGARRDADLRPAGWIVAGAIFYFVVFKGGSCCCSCTGSADDINAASDRVSPCRRCDVRDWEEKLDRNPSVNLQSVTSSILLSQVRLLPHTKPAIVGRSIVG